MIHREVSESYIKIPYLLRLDDDGRFEELAEPMQRSSSDRQIDDYGVVDVPADTDQVLLGVTQWHLIHLEDVDPPLIVQGADRRAFFLRTGTSEKKPDTGIFTGVRRLIENHDQINPRTLELIRFIDETEFAKFGITALRQVVK